MLESNKMSAEGWQAAVAPPSRLWMEMRMVRVLYTADHFSCNPERTGRVSASERLQSVNGKQDDTSKTTKVCVLVPSRYPSKCCRTGPRWDGSMVY